MEIEKLSPKERYDLLSEIADLFYNQGKTQIEIATQFDLTRFKVAKLIQDARTEQVVEIKINFSNQRNKSMEEELSQRFPLKKALVINTQNTPYIDNLKVIGQVASEYLSKILIPNSVLGITWGRSIYSAIHQLPQKAHNPISAVQLTGYLPHGNPFAESRELVKNAAACHFGNAYYLNAPIYFNDLELKSRMQREPDLFATLCKTQELTVSLTGIGGRSSSPLANSAFRSYLSPQDTDALESCVGSIYGYVLDARGKVADIPLNQKLMAAELSDILRTPYRVGIAYGRHKTQVLKRVMENEYINVLITDSDTAQALLS